MLIHSIATIMKIYRSKGATWGPGHHPRAGLETGTSGFSTLRFNHCATRERAVLGQRR